MAAISLRNETAQMALRLYRTEKEEPWRWESPFSGQFLGNLEVENALILGM